MKEKPSYYAIIPANVRYDTRLKANEKLLYGEITALTEKTGECWASNNYFANLYSVDPSAISKWIKNLNDCNYIKTDCIYKNNSKEIEKRVIKMVLTNINRGIDKFTRGVLTNEGEGYCQKDKDNNTSNNNTSVNNITPIIPKNDIEKMFDAFWEIYPNKKARANAYKSFVKVVTNKELFEEIMNKVKLYKQTTQWLKDNGQFIPHPATWLNQKRWEDELEIKNIKKITTKDLKIDISDF